MRQRTRRALVLAGVVAAVVVILAVAAALIAPHLVDLQFVRSQVVAQIARRLGADVTVGAMRLTLLPWPHIELTTVGLSIPQVIDGTFASVAIRPRVLPLLRGRVRLASLSIDGAHVKVALPPTPDGTDASPGLELSEIRQSVAAMLAAATAAGDAIGPETVLLVEDSQVELTGPSVPLSLHDVNARIGLPPGQLDVHLTCGANLADRLTLAATVDTQRKSGSARLDLVRLRLQPAVAPLIPEPWPRLEDAEVNLNLSLSTDGFANWNGEFRGSLPVLTMSANNQPLIMRGTDFNGTVSVSEGSVQATLGTLKLEAPRLNLTGRFSSERTPPLLGLELNGTDVDVGAVRDVAMTMAPSDPVVQAIFDVLRDGTVSQIALRTQGPSVDALVDALAIEGTLGGGRIHVPGVDLDFEQVQGRGKVVGAVLEGEAASGRLGNAHATDASLRVGLSDDAPLLNMRAMVQADARELPALLKHIAPKQPVVRQLERLDGLSGTVTGTLVLEGTTRDVAVLVEMSDVALSGRYRGLRLPLRLSGGPVSVSGEGIVAQGLTVSAGATQLAVTSGRIGFGRSPSLTVSCGPSRIILHELHPSLRAAGWLRGTEDTLASIEGTVAAQSVEIRGPLNDARAWRLALTGAVNGFDLDSAARESFELRGPIALTNVRLRHDGAAAATSLSATFAARGGIQGALDAGWDQRELAIKRLQIRDRESDALLNLLAKPQHLAITFAGHLEQSTVTALFSKPDMIGSAVSGSFRADIPLDQPMRTDIQGRVEARQIAVPLSDDVTWTVEHFTLDGAAKQAGIEAVVRTAADGRVEVKGTVHPSSDTLQIDLDLTTNELDVAALDPLVDDDDRPDGVAARKGWFPPLRGTLRVAADRVRYRTFTWHDVRAAVTLDDKLEANVTAATLCGIATPARIADEEEGISIALQASATNQELDPALECLVNDPGLTSGNYDLSAEIAMGGPVDALARTTDGTVALEAVDGRINRISVLARLFSVLSIATGSLGNVLNLTNEGIPYRRITVTGNIRKGVLQLTQAIFDGPTVKIVGEGSIDIPANKLALTLLVAPLVTFDRIVGYIPIVRDVVGGLVSIPVKVGGTLDKPSATPLDPGVVSERLVGLMKRTVNLPFRLFSR